jgi:hypothetical protein
VQAILRAASPVVVVVCAQIALARHVAVLVISTFAALLLPSQTPKILDH